MRRIHKRRIQKGRIQKRRIQKRRIQQSAGITVAYTRAIHLDLVLHLSMMDVVQKENKRCMTHIAGTTAACNACDVLCCM